MRRVQFRTKCEVSRHKITNLPLLLSRESDSNLNSDVTRPWDGFTFHLLWKHLCENAMFWTILVRAVRIFQNLAAGQTNTAERSRRRSRSLLMKTNRRRRSGPPQAHGPASQHGHGRTPGNPTKNGQTDRGKTGRGRERKNAYLLSAQWAWNPGGFSGVSRLNSPPETRIHSGGRS